MVPARRCWQCVDSDIDSWPPATIILASPDMICCMPMAMARRPEPQTWLSPQAVASFGTPALIAAWRAGFWPWPAVSTWPRMTSSTSPASTPARASTSLTATLPRSCAGTAAKAPLKEPTGVRAALATTMEADMMFSRLEGLRPGFKDFSSAFPLEVSNRKSANLPCGSRAQVYAAQHILPALQHLIYPALHKPLGIAELLGIS